MAKKNYFKRVIAGTLAILTVAAYLPENVGTGGLLSETTIFAKAIDIPVEPSGAGTVTVDNGTYTATANEGYRFSYWSYDISEENLTDLKVTDNPIEPDSGISNLVAHFQKIQTSFVTLIVNEGTINSGDITEYTEGEGAKLPTDITRDGYIFAGWYDNDEFMGNPVTEISATDTGDKTYYAKWEPMITQLILSNLGDIVVTDSNDTEVTDLTVLTKGTYYIYTNKSIADSDATAALNTGYKKKQTYNGKTYQYRYEIEIPTVPEDGYVLSHTNNWVGKVETSNPSTLLIGEDGIFDNVGAVLKGEGTYYYGDKPSAESVQIKEGFENGIISVGEVYFAQANGARIDTPVVGKTYYLTAEVFVDKSAETEDPNNDVSVFYLKQTVNYEKRPLADCEVYLKNGETEERLTVKNNAVTVPANTLTYNGEAQKPEIVIRNNVLGTETTLTSSDYTDTIEAQTNAREYSAILTAADSTNYSGSLTVNWSIAKAQADIKATPVETIIYDGTPLDETDFIFEGANADLVNDKETYPNTKVTVSGTDITNAGERKADIRITFDNYQDINLSADKAVDVTIQKRNVRVTPADGQSIIYGTEEPPKLNFTTEKAVDVNNDNAWDTNTGVIPADVESVDFAPTLLIKDFDYIYFKNNVDTYEYEISDVALDNYTAILDGTAVFTVEPKELTEDMFTVELEDADYTFDGTTKLAPKYTFFDGKYKDRYKTAKMTANDFVAGGTDHAVLPGHYTLEFSGQGNYTGFVSFDWEIKPIQEYSIFASVDDKIYDGKAVVPTSYLYETVDDTRTPVTTIKGVKTTYTYYAVNNGELTKLDGAPKDAGSYRLEVSKTAKGYTFDNYCVDFRIEKKEIAITPNTTGKIFGKEADPDFADFSYDESAVIEGETPEITGEYALEGYEGNAGSYKFNLGTVAIDSDNYFLTISGNYVVEQQELTDENIIVFKECKVSDDGWSYPGDCIKVTGIEDGKEIELVRPVYDDNTGEYINTDFKFISATKTKKPGEISVQIQGIGNYTGFAEAIIKVNQENQENHYVTVENGSFANGETSAYFKDGAVAVVTADKPSDGYKFGYWKKNGSTISYNPTYTFFVTADYTELEAVYLEDTDDIEKYGNAVIESVSPDKVNRKIQFVSTLNVPEGCKILKAGIVATSDETKSANLTDSNADYVRCDENLTVRNYKYTWTKTNVNETWYVKGYLVYEDANGTVKTIYSDLAKATLDGYEIIKEDKILGTAVMESVIPDTEEKKIQFVAMLNVPADCTINKAGIVATSDSTKAENLTADNADYVRTNTTTKHGYRYTWTKTNVNETWYVRPYLVYTNADGKEFTVYGELATGNLN